MKQNLLVSFLTTAISAVLFWAFTDSWVLTSAGLLVGALTFATILFVRFCSLYFVSPRNEIKRLQRQLDRSEDKTRKIQEKLERQIALEQRPNFIAQIQEFSLGVTTENSENFTVAWMMVGLRNKGASSITQNWRLIVSFPGLAPRQLLVLPTVHLGETSLTDASGRKFGFDADESIVNKVGPGKPLSNTGNMVNGFINFHIPVDMDLINVHGTTMVLEFEDIDGHPYSVTQSNFPCLARNWSKYIPGTKMKVTQRSQNEPKKNRKSRRSRKGRT